MRGFGPQSHLDSTLNPLCPKPSSKTSFFGSLDPRANVGFGGGEGCHFGA